MFYAQAYGANSGAQIYVIRNEEMSKRKHSDIEEQPEIKKFKTVRLGERFFDQQCKDLAIGLLGTFLVRKVDGQLVSGKIVETEAYLGITDQAAHSYQGKRTSRNEAMFMKPGTCYVYSIYGVHHCVNISSFGEGAAVLIRALEPVCGIEKMRQLRGNFTGDEYHLCKGPGNLCKALHITKEQNKEDMITSSEIWLEACDSVIDEQQIISSSRIGIDYAGLEWSTKPLRFYVKDSLAVSKHKKHSTIQTKIK